LDKAIKGQEDILKLTTAEAKSVKIDRTGAVQDGRVIVLINP
jgi:hypothetical protein